MNTRCTPRARIFKKREEIVFRTIVGETLLIPIRTKLADMQRIFSLNPVGQYIWKQLDGTKSVDDLCDDVMTVFDVGRQQADDDVQEFITELVRADLIVEVP